MRKLVAAPEAVDSWGWRIPFLLGLIIGPVGLFIRHLLINPSRSLLALSR
jgi:MFS family permease